MTPQRTSSQVRAVVGVPGARSDVFLLANFSSFSVSGSTRGDSSGEREARLVSQAGVCLDFFIGSSSVFGPRRRLVTDRHSLAGGPMKVAGEVGQSAAAGAPAHAGSRDGTPVSPATHFTEGPGDD